MTLLFIVLANLIISLISLVSLFLLRFNTKTLRKILIYLVAFAAGSMLGVAFLHLIPESAEGIALPMVTSSVLLSFLFFMLFEKLLGWHHHHDIENDMHIMGIMNLLADAVHNFLDGLLIAAAFMTNVNLGLLASVAVILHEIPQELGDFGVLLHSGFTPKKAILANVSVAIIAIVGGIVGYYWLSISLGFVPYINALAAGGFLYVATSDLLPVVKSESKFKNSWLSYLIFLLGIGLFSIL